MPNGDNYCDSSVPDLKDLPNLPAEEKKFIRAMAALEGGCPGYSCACDTTGNFLHEILFDQIVLLESNSKPTF